MMHLRPIVAHTSTGERVRRSGTTATRLSLLVALGAGLASMATAQAGDPAPRGAVANLSITNTASTPTAVNGQPITYTIVATNAGTNAADNARLTTATQAGTTFASLTSPAAWGCTMPAVGGTGDVACTVGSFAIGSATFSLTVTVDPALPPSTITSTAAIASDTADTNPNNNSATASTSTPVSLQSFSVD